MSLNKEALRYHAEPPAGKVNVQPSKSTAGEWELSLAYSPGVAAPCKEIAKNPQDVYKYTTKGNLVAVISDGTAVLGLGNIGPEASKPVMEGKGVLFKQFANINVFDLELKSSGVEEFIATCKALEPTFGGINLEDIKAPECFEIEERLKKELKIPVFHDDQHGTAIISAAALINAVDLTGRKLEDLKMVVNGAGAAAVACARLFFNLGVKPQNLIMCDSKGVIYKGRTEGMNPFKEEFANNTEARSLADAMKGADCFVGVSVGGAVTKDMVKSMADKPIVFAMANPDPEILPTDAKEARPDVIMATGRSDFANQVNNVLGFPSIFRGALDTASTAINEEMKLAAVHALAKLARQEIPEKVSQAYGGQNFSYGPEYIIPKPFDPRVLLWVAPAVAKAAMDSGVATQPIEDFDAYKDRLEAMQGYKVGFVRSAINRVKSQCRTRNKNLPKIIFPEGASSKILKACNILIDEKVVHPVLVGYPENVKKVIEENKLDSLRNHLETEPIIHPSSHKNYRRYVEELYRMRQRKGVMEREAERLIGDPHYFAAMAVHLGDADGMVSGATIKYAEAVKPILQIIGTGRRNCASGLNLVLLKDKVVFFADTAVNINPTAEQLATAAIHAGQVAEYFGISPKIAMLSYTNFTGRGESPRKMQEAARLVAQQKPNYTVDGEMQADTAVNSEVVERIFPFAKTKDGANILIFPNLDSGNISYKLVQQLGGAEVIGPFLMGVKKPANVLQRTSVVDDIVNTVVLTALECQAFEENY